MISVSTRNNMPAYDYKCKHCGHQAEIVHEMGTVKKKCPQCKKNGLEKMWLKVAAYHDRFSPMHPRKGRGKGNTGVATKATRKKLENNE
jgi:putative FmdB family regulatory protein